jgi:hypothetical protein
MARVRISTTVDQDLLSSARQVHQGLTDAVLIDAALGALVAASRHAEIDAQYAAYLHQPLTQPDEWGDLQSFREAASNS